MLFGVAPISILGDSVAGTLATCSPLYLDHHIVSDPNAVADLYAAGRGQQETGCRWVPRGGWRLTRVGVGVLLRWGIAAGYCM